MSQKNQEVADWEKDLDQKEINERASQPQRHPQLKPKLDAIYDLVILSPIKKTKTEEFPDQDSWIMDVNYNGVTRTLFLGETMRKQLSIQRKRLGIKPSDLINRNITIQKVERKNKEGRIINVFLVELK